MKKCVNCEIEIGGDIRVCPLCQNHLSGAASPNNWPGADKLKMQAFAYKLQLFIALAIMVVCLGVDFLLDIDFGAMKHWGLILAAWIIVVELTLRNFLRKSLFVVKILSVSAIDLAVLMVLTAWYYNFLRPTLYIGLPILLSALMVANLLFSLWDKTENAMVYLLANILGGIIPYIVLLLSHRTRSLAWSICLMISVVTFIGIVVFKGRKVWLEIQKRMNI